MDCHFRLNDISIIFFHNNITPKYSFWVDQNTIQDYNAPKKSFIKSSKK